MNVGELKAAIDTALERGLDPLTTVVIDMVAVTNPTDAVWPIVAAVHDPNADDEGYLWFTITPSNDEADMFLTRGHQHEGAYS
jgi:hypothetical protein